MSTSFETERALRPELAHGERLLWSGRPARGVRFRAGDLFLVPFSLLWGGFAIFWESTVLAKGAPLFFALWGVPFVLVGLYLIIGRFFVDAYQRARTTYGVTDQRVIIISGLVSRAVQSLALRNLGDISLRERADRSGSITFGPTSPMYAMWYGSGWPGMDKKLAPAFEFIENVREVHDLIRRTQRAAERER
jgi:Bacterial PH domain